MIITFVVVGYIALRYIANVLVPVLAALGIAYLLNPVLERLVRYGMSRPVGAAFLVITFISLIVGAIALAVPAITHQLADTAHDLPRMMTNLDLWLHDHFNVEMPKDWKQYAT